MFDLSLPFFHIYIWKGIKSDLHLSSVYTTYKWRSGEPWIIIETAYFHVILISMIANHN
jgi:hypothetical protein